MVVSILGGIAVLGGLATAAGYVWLALGFATNKDNELDAFSFLSIFTICCPVMPFFVFRLKRPDKEPLFLLFGGLAVTVGALFALDFAKGKDPKKEPETSDSALALTNAPPSRPAPDLAPPAPPPPAVKIPEMNGKPVDLSSIMGRARALAEKWQPDATLAGVEATQVSASVVHTDTGGKATLTFGPSPFAPPRPDSSSFVVTYDQQGLRGVPAKARAGKPLTEPMCAPERLPALTGGASASVRYSLGPDGEPAWFVSDPANPRAKPRMFQADSCQERRGR